MDPHSEVEVKFQADEVTFREFRKWVTDLVQEADHTDHHMEITNYKRVFGTDTYFVINGEPVRYRHGGDKESELTYKRRKSSDSTADRIEINLPLKQGVEPRTVAAFLQSFGAVEDFTIDKMSYIFHLDGTLGTGPWEPIPYKATIVLYDVWFPQSDNHDRYIEVEIEASSTCTPAQGLVVLDVWTQLVQNCLQVQGPMNKSLYEIYTTRGTDK